MHPLCGICIPYVEYASPMWKTPTQPQLTSLKYRRCRWKPSLGRRMRKDCVWPAASRATCVTSMMRGFPLPPQSVVFLSM